MSASMTTTRLSCMLCLGLVLAVLLVWSPPALAAIQVDCRVITHEFDGTNFVITISVQPVGTSAVGALSKAFTGAASAIATPAAAVTFLKNQIISFMAGQPFNMTVTANEIALWGGPQ